MADTEKKREAGASRKRGSSRGVKAAEKTIEKTEDKSGKQDGDGKRGTSRRSAASKKAGSSKSERTGKRTSGKAGNRREASEQTEQDSFMKTEVAIIVTFAVSVLLFLSNFGLCGAIGGICRSILLGIFGLLGYLAPILLLIGTCFYLSNRGNIRAVIKMASVGLVLLSLCGLDQMILGGGMQEGWKLAAYYSAAAAGENGGGLLGGLLAVMFSSLFGKIGAYIVLLLGLVIGMVCITEKSLVNLVKRSSGRAYQYAREDMSRRREQHEERKEEKRRLREEQRVRGVNLDVTALMELPVPETKWGTDVPETVRVPEEPKKPFQTERTEDAVNPADVFRGKIHRAGTMSVSEEAELPCQDTEAVLPQDSPAASVPEQTEPEEEKMGDDYLLRDTRTVAELSGWTLGASAKTGPGYQAVPVTEPSIPCSAASVSFDEDMSTASDFEDAEEISMDSSVSYSEQPIREVDVFSAEPEEEKNEPLLFQQEEPEDDWSQEEESFSDPMQSADPVQMPEQIEAEREEWPVSAPLEKKEEKTVSNTRVSQTPAAERNVNEEIERRQESEQTEKKEYVFPPLHLLKKDESARSAFSDQEYKETAIKLQQTLQNFGVGVTVTNISCGPTVTRYELHPEQGVKVSKIVALADDIKLNLAAADIRIEAPIPGKAAVGIEVPNKENSTVLLRDLLESDTFKHHDSRLAFAVGKDIGGQTVVSDIAKMPHLLIAGATGSGKSVCINTLIMSVIYKAKPDEVKLIMIDPKVVELSVYNGIPHLLIPVVTDPKKASGALNWAVTEMMDRYAKFAKYGVRDLKGFNAKVDSIQDIEDPNKPQKLPQIIIIVDELADLMMVAPSEVEDAICRLAQLARAAGIHLVIATQRPSVNVITGVIKANIPSRIAFSVSSGVDSRTIIDMVGAEKLLGKGDMLFYPSGYQKPQRVQGAFVSDQEVSAVVEFLTEQGMTAEYSTEIQSKIGAAQPGEIGSAASERDTYFVQAGRFIIEKDKASIGMLQRMFKIGFNRAARIMDQLADAGVVGEEEGTKPRKVLMSMEQFENLLEQE